MKKIVEKLERLPKFSELTKKLRVVAYANSSFVNAEVKKYMKEACDEIETKEIKILNG
ncbi:TPA: hypothetical protein U2B41_002239 [Streptococcus suis]|nr:hypothetical protein [Streptococcus suis]HEM5970917.1 hypothetical protein [Streptococcus suis]HEM6000381.1 hypothetical protein [Streptococcus suis]HEM6000934.1 hypothetical protein [Streptococcus suis]